MGGVKLDGGTKTTIFDYNTDFAIFVSTISQICQFFFFDYSTDFAIFAYLRDWFFKDLFVTPCIQRGYNF